MWPEHWTQLAVYDGMHWRWFAQPFCTLDPCFVACADHEAMLVHLILLQDRTESSAVLAGYARSNRRWLGGPCQDALECQLARFNNPQFEWPKAV